MHTNVSLETIILATNGRVLIIWISFIPIYKIMTHLWNSFENLETHQLQKYVILLVFINDFNRQALFALKKFSSSYNNKNLVLHTTIRFHRKCIKISNSLERVNNPSILILMNFKLITGSLEKEIEKIFIFIFVIQGSF